MLAVVALGPALGADPTGSSGGATKTPPETRSFRLRDSAGDRDRQREMDAPGSGWRPWQRWETCTDANGVRFRCLR
jgi:hypothetical protein